MSALGQLLDMGIPKSRARAALWRTNNDVMSAAERIFAGEFDDIISDEGDGEDLHGAGPDAENSCNDNGKDNDGNDDGNDGNDNDKDDDNDDDNNDDESLSEDSIHGMGGNDVIDNTTADPYASVFFSKDRTETIIEPVSDTEDSGDQDSSGVLSRAEWMRGCPEGNEQSLLFQHYTYLESGNLSCPRRCGNEYTRRPEDFFQLLPNFSAYEHHLESRVCRTCPKCAQIMCLACDEGVHETSVKEKGGRAKPRRDQKLLHCPNLQVSLRVMIGMGLYMFDKTFCGPPSTDSHPNTTISPPHWRVRPLPKAPSGRTTPLHVYNGTGFAGDAEEDTSGQEAAIEAQEKIDFATSEVLRQVLAYLPNLDRLGGPCISDHMVHPTTLAHLRRRSIFVNDLLRNDSLLDMTSRETLYAALFDWLKLVSSHESLASMLAMPQMRPVKSEVDPKDPNRRVVIYEGASSPRELLEVCAIQAKAALKSFSDTRYTGLSEGVSKEQMRQEALQLTKAELDERNGEDDHFKTFCQRIVATAGSIDRSLAEVKGHAFVEKMRDSLPKIPGAGDLVIKTQEAGSSSEAVKKIYGDWATKARFQYCDLSSGEGYRHRYDPNLKTNSVAGTGHRGRVRAIAQEMGILCASLPVGWDSSILVRVDSSRPDCLKAMITGPRGTPYENGCFIFDIHLPIEYNNVAPMVSSMTTNGGKYRYNPNLYANGHVCLSLLGTYTGPGWIAGKSTLLQVLISIQSLILCEEPYLNEPGWASLSGSAKSKSYSANVRRMVIMEAMANNIEKPPFPFETEIKTHFRLKKDEIRLQLDAWKKIDDGHLIADIELFSGHSEAIPARRSRSPFDEGADRLRSLLDTLEI